MHDLQAAEKKQTGGRKKETDQYDNPGERLYRQGVKFTAKDVELYI